MSSLKLKICKFLDNRTAGRRFLRAYLKSYLKIIPKMQKQLNQFPQNKSKQVWTMWLQEDIPEICDICIRSIKKYYPEVVLITEKNISQYIKINNIILQKYKCGKIKPAHFSDYIRMCLLDKYGGLWIDSTCFLTQNIPDEIWDYEFFVLKNDKTSEFSNYFIYSDSNQYITRIMKTFLEKYWIKEDEEPYYYFFHLFMKLLIKHDKKVKEIWDKIPDSSELNQKLLWQNLFKNYNEAVYEKLKNENYLYKLTYRKFEEKNTNKNNLYSRIKQEFMS